ncbi:polymorphic toxin-type HINT domain-containing protein, partial [Actinoplanes sp. NPDC051633]|uniref:polymorphic toxin-type HINT domain-containing protein n=1 Tax=Actinoplanes sp. NPDC051633 TaxID=3155670 RepID=UPI00343F6A69
DEFVPAGELEPGDTVVTTDGSTLAVAAVKPYSQRQRVYNLTVDDIHTYYVFAGTTPVLVHNCGVTPNNSPGTLGDELAAADRAGVRPAGAGSPEFQSAVNGGGRHIWSVSENGSLNIAPWGESIKHPILNGGGPVRGAGEVVFDRGMVTNINNATGHYTPSCRCGADLQSGVDAFMNAGVPVSRRGITPFGW